MDKRWTDDRIERDEAEILKAQDVIRKAIENPSWAGKPTWFALTAIYLALGLISELKRERLARMGEAASNGGSDEDEVIESSKMCVEGAIDDLHTVFASIYNPDYPGRMRKIEGRLSAMTDILKSVE